MARSKKRLTDEQEFEVMKLVLDKFLWLGFIVMGWGMFTSIRDASILPGVWYLIGGGVILFLFLGIILKEYEVFR